MYCSSCGSPLQPGAQICPTCGIPTPTSPANQEPASYDRTVPASSANQEPVAYDRTVQASTAYGSDADAVFPTQPVSQDPYSMPHSMPPSPPYNMPPPPPPPYASPRGEPSPSYPPPRVPTASQGPKRRGRFPGGLIPLLLALIALLLVGSGLLYYATVYQPKRMHAQATTTAATSTAQAHATNQVQLKATATAAAENPYAQSGTLALVDPLSKNNKRYAWDENTNCAFINGTYHAIAPDARYSDYCTAYSTDFSNLTYEVQMTILKGDAGGVIFRMENTNPNQYYDFHIDQDGTYRLEAVSGSGGPTLKQGSSSAIKRGLNQTNLIAVVVQSTNIALYVNRQSLGSINDNTYKHGQIGLYAVVYTQPTEVAFSNAKVWFW
jgi:hypothetical protein